MEQNQNIVDRVNDEFLKRMHEDSLLSAIACDVGKLIATHDKPKADQFINIYQSNQSKEPKAE